MYFRIIAPAVFLAAATWIPVSLLGSPPEPTQVFNRVKSSVVVVMAYTEDGLSSSQGSGVKLPSGYVVTNFHVVRGQERVFVGQGRQFHPATICAFDAEKDLCLLDVPGAHLEPIQVGHSTSLKVGSIVYAVGSPEGLELSLSQGLVSQFRGATPSLIQITAAISHGSSGGGLFNSNGQLVGITTFSFTEGQNLNFALPVEWIDAVLSSQSAKKPSIEVEKIHSVAEWIKWSDHASELEEAKKFSEEIGWLREWVAKTGGDETTAFAFLGDAYEKQGRWSEAAKAYREMTWLNPDDARAWDSLAEVLFKLKNWTLTAVAYRECVRLEPYNVEALDQLAWAYLNLGKDFEAFQVARQRTRISPKDPWSWESLARISAMRGDVFSELDAVEHVRKLDPARGEQISKELKLK